ncbi:adhesin-like protein [methanogenic archaeon ISO4-H5]|nr:adhesin-like protein [methanogenic archaeon ISO4-H5]
MKKTAIIILVLMTALVVVPVSSADSSEDTVLVDFGNGSYKWYSNNGGGTFNAVLDSSVDAGTADTIRNVSTSDCKWRLFVWNGSWEDKGTSLSASCSGTVAYGYYPEGFAPVSTPEYRDSWTTLGGSSTASNISVSHGQRNPKVPVEWYNTYTTGYVDSGLVVAGNMLYHTTGGVYEGAGEDADAWVYALDRFSGSVVWKYHGVKGAGYEVTTPLIVGDYLIVTFTCGDVVCFDRFTGTIKDKMTVDNTPPLDSDGNVVWNGRTFYTGGTTPVYDSGRIYFGTSAGTVLCLQLSASGTFSTAWEYVPPSTVEDNHYTGTRGCFYFHAPTVYTVDGQRMLFIGNYDGYVHAVNADTGVMIWVRRVIDMSADNRAAPGTPGSAASVSMSPDGSHLLVGCTDGALFSLEGYLLALDPLTGNEMTRSDSTAWKLDGLFTSPVITVDGFYSYVSPLSAGSDIFPKADGSSDAVTNSVYFFNWDGKVVWKTGEYQMIKGALTMDADGILYGTDYSAGSFWPTGGALTAWDSSNGSEIWRVLLSPYTQDSYSMVQPTVIDGKIYTGNDYGAVYCLSDIKGEGTEEERVQALQSVGFAHWSWYLTVAVAAITIAGFTILYRRG